MWPPHSRFKFDSNRYLLRQDVICHSPGAHKLLTWTKTLQENSSHRLVQIPTLTNCTICPVRALHDLLDSRPLSSTSTLFVHNFHPYHPVIDTTLRDGLRKVLTHLGIPLMGPGFHTFRRSGATLAYDNNVQLQHIIAHGLWRSSAVWTYLQNASSIVPLTFASCIPPHL